MHTGLGSPSCSNAIMLKAKPLCEINGKIIQACVFWMKHSKPPLQLPFLRLLVMGVFGRVRKWLRGYPRTLQRRVSDVSGWKYLKRLGYTLQTPRPQHQAAATPEAQQTFKKKLKERVATLESQHPEKPVEIWAEDETRLGLLPVHRRVWAKRGERPIAPVCPAYKWALWFRFCPSTDR